ncbi:phospholipase A1 [Plutella xylostella]|uniref:phospholipase A1 n=1 Tax=Plutella xylostella TaxID=51655 RepID=UPI002032DE30|nr:phospholipase A1 [Plutella xylostella]
MFRLLLLPLLLFLSTVNSSIYDIAVNNIKCTCDRTDDYDVSEVKLYITNYASGGAETSYFIRGAGAAVVDSPDFDPTQCINVFILGFNTPITHEAVDGIKCVFSNITCNGKKTLGIIVEHIKYTGDSGNPLTTIPMYQRSVKYTKSIGLAIGKFLEVVLSKVSRDYLNVAGHSLGAHMAGYGAEYLKSIGIPLKVIYGTDPAGPCYKDCLEEHMQSGQADLVVAMHCTNSLGSTENVSDYDFYSNDGEYQKGCPKEGVIGMSSVKCSHYKCIALLLNPAIRDSIWDATKCSNFKDYDSGACGGRETTLAGYTVNMTGSPGVYYFEPTATLPCDITVTS